MQIQELEGDFKMPAVQDHCAEGADDRSKATAASRQVQPSVSTVVPPHLDNKQVQACIAHKEAMQLDRNELQA